MKSLYLPALAATTVLVAAGTSSTPISAATFVSTELVLSVDVSGSIDGDEFGLQRSSYANAFRDPSIVSLIESLNNGIAVTFQYWASDTSQTLPWYHVTNAGSAFAFANAIESASRPFEGLTNIAGALNEAREAILNNGFVAERAVIDISSDGRQNTRTNVSRNPSIDDLCAPRIRRRGFSRVVSNDDLDDSCLNRVRSARDTAVSSGITINGLPILTEHDDLGDYFAANVIGGQGAFLQPAAGFSDFQQALVAKIRREIQIQVDEEAATAPPVPTVAPLVPPVEEEAPVPPPPSFDTPTLEELSAYQQSSETVEQARLASILNQQVNLLASPVVPTATNQFLPPTAPTPIPIATPDPLPTAAPTPLPTATPNPPPVVTSPPLPTPPTPAPPPLPTPLPTSVSAPTTSPLPPPTAIPEPGMVLALGMVSWLASRLRSPDN